MPSSVTQAYRILNGTAPGDPGSAQSFLEGMGTLERRARQRSESRSEVRVKKRRKPMGTKPYPFTSRQYA